MILGGGLIAAGLLLLRMANKQPNGQAVANSSSTESLPVASDSGNPAKGKQPPHTKEEVAFEMDPKKRQEMIENLRDYYRELYPDASDKQINEYLKTEYGLEIILGDTAPEGTTLEDDEFVADLSKPKEYNDFLYAMSKLQVANTKWDEYLSLSRKIEENKDILIKQGSYDKRSKKINENIEYYSNETVKWREKSFSALELYIKFLVENRFTFYSKSYESYEYKNSISFEDYCRLNAILFDVMAVVTDLGIDYNGVDMTLRPLYLGIPFCLSDITGFVDKYIEIYPDGKQVRATNLRPIRGPKRPPSHNPPTDNSRQYRSYELAPDYERAEVLM